MLPSTTAETTHVLGAPKDWDVQKRGPCGGLPVKLAEDGFHSFWYPSMDELKALLAGKPIRLVVASGSHPPVRLEVG